VEGDVQVEQSIKKAEALIEALAYIQEFRNRITVIKLGGAAMEEPAGLEATIEDVVFMSTVGMRPVIVHGGGKPISRAMAEAGIEPRFVQGRRYTDPDTLEIVCRVLAEEINTDIVGRIEAAGGMAMGVSHRTRNCLVGERLHLTDDDGQPIDLGLVGGVTSVDATFLENLCRAGVVPVIPSIAVDSSGERLNVNADTAAAAVAGALKAEKLVFLSDTHGVLTDRSDDESMASTLTPSRIDELVADGTIASGMLPKVQGCRTALAAGVRKTHIVDGRIRHSLLLEIYTDKGIGTQIVR
jgi:acetylglutamate kinase